MDTTSLIQRQVAGAAPFAQQLSWRAVAVAPQEVVAVGHAQQRLRRQLQQPCSVSSGTVEQDNAVPDDGTAEGIDGRKWCPLATRGYRQAAL